MRVFCLILLCVLSGCRKNRLTEIQAVPTAKVDHHKLPGEPVCGSVQTLPSGVQIYVLEEGKGATPVAGDKVYVQYRGYLPIGIEIDSSERAGKPLSFVLGAGGVIAGWEDAVAHLHRGSRAKVIIPWEHAYGTEGSAPSVPPESPLIFDMTLLLE